jgi:glycosyltransferase involved in cell wall biosynthesis
MRIAVIHDWLITAGGSEKVLREILYLLRNQDTTLFTLMDFLTDEDREEFIFGKKPQTSFLQLIPGIKENYKYFFPLFPRAIRSLHTKGFDVIISSSHSVAKSIHKHPEQTHISYCHTPMRYIWDMRQQYISDHGLNKGWKRLAAKPLMRNIRNWDFATSSDVDFFIANSKYIQNRIKKNYHRDSTVIYPPVNTDFFMPGDQKEAYYVTASRLVPYKRIDLIAKAFSEMPDKKLIIIGNGPDWKTIKSIATTNIEMIKYNTYEVLRYYLQRAKAFVFAAEEDFGITPVEAMACGTPVIAFGKGGVLETVQDENNGIFFHHQTVKSIVDAVYRFENQQSQFDPHKIRQQALKFNRQRFHQEMASFLEKHAGIVCSL